ncbi:MAG: hypothetical protein K2P74_10390 [Nitrosomonas sp.]|nr:hypothetical protein [Nitrosomonas sp.]
MGTVIPLFSTPLPNTLSQTAEEFEQSANTLVSELNPIFSAVNSAVSEMNQLALNAESAAGELANAAWVSGTTYTAGQVRYSPIDFFSYRRKTNGAGTTDPSLDPANWALQTRTTYGGSDTTSSAVDITLTSSSGRLQVVTMTALGKKVTLPAANSLQKGANLYVIKNAGAYRFGVRKNGGIFICYVNPGQVVAFSCADISTAAGVWVASGNNIETIYSGNTPEVLNSVDSRFISVAMLSPTKAICAYKNLSTGFMEAVVLNYGSASGTPLEISAEAVKNISIAALSATKAVVVYQANAGSTNIKGYVLDISGNTITPGTVKPIVTAAGTTGANGTSLTALSSTKLLLAYMYSGATTIKERVLDVSGTTITENLEVTADSSSFSTALTPYLMARMISATKGLVAFIGGTSQMTLRLQSISGSTPTPSGSVLSIIGASTVQLAVTFAVVIMNSNRALVIRGYDRTYGDITAFVIDISGTTPVLVTAKNIPADLNAAGVNIYASKLDANRAYMTWTGGYGRGSDSCVLTLTSDDRILIDKTLELIDPGITDAPWYMACEALDSSHVMQVTRNASTFLSAKTIEIG